jgi:hypothetical protein
MGHRALRETPPLLSILRSVRSGGHRADPAARKNPTIKPGQRKQKLFQWLTEDVGHPRLREHLTAVIALMKASTKWDQFYSMIQRALPKYGEQIRLANGVNED